MPVLSKEDRAFWEGNGYVVVHNAVPQENLDAMVTTVWEFLEMDPERAEDWYKYQPYTRDNLCSPISAAGMVEIYQHQALWDNRQYPKVHQAFAEVWGDEKLWVSLDRANMKPPAREDRPEWCNKGMIHWDVDTSTAAGVLWGARGAVFDGYDGGPRRFPMRTRLPPDIRRMGQNPAGRSRHAPTRSAQG